MYNVLFSAAKACQGDLCGWLIFSGVYSSTMKICKAGEVGGMLFRYKIYIFSILSSLKITEKVISVVVNAVCSWVNTAIVTSDLCLLL